MGKHVASKCYVLTHSYYIYKVCMCIRKSTNVEVKYRKALKWQCQSYLWLQMMIFTTCTVTGVKICGYTAVYN